MGDVRLVSPLELQSASTYSTTVEALLVGVYLGINKKRTQCAVHVNMELDLDLLTQSEVRVSSVPGKSPLTVRTESLAASNRDEQKDPLPALYSKLSKKGRGNMNKAILSTALLFLAIHSTGCNSLRNITGIGRKTCLVLSVGGTKGLAHLGAIEALKNRGERIDCVFGNSMGSLIGALYAHSPNGDTTENYKELMRTYVRRTIADKKNSAVSGGLLFALGSLIITGGAVGWETLAAAIVGGKSGMDMTKEIDNDRLKASIAEQLADASFSQLPVQLGIAYQEKRGEGLEMRYAEGPVADAVANSVNNPYIFSGTSLDFVDPGADRAAVVPIEDACRLFRPTRIIAINVTGARPFYSREMDCSVIEISVVVPRVENPSAVMIGEGPEFEMLLRSGKDAVMSQL